MNKSAAITALAVSALTLASCSSEAPNDAVVEDDTTQTTTEPTTDDADGGAAGESTAEQTATDDSAESISENASGANNGSRRFDEAALKGELEGLGYTCDDDDDCQKTDGAIIYDIDVDNDSVDVEVQGNNDLDQHFETILSDVGTAFGDWDFGGASWDEIETWALEASEDQETVIGNVEVDHDRGEDDGTPTRDLSIELQNS